jgi:hypothetical protein
VIMSLTIGLPRGCCARETLVGSAPRSLLPSGVSRRRMSGFAVIRPEGTRTSAGRIRAAAPDPLRRASCPTLRRSDFVEAHRRSSRHSARAHLGVDVRQLGGCFRGDQRRQPFGVQVLGDQVAEHIQTCLARVWGPGGRRSNPVSPTNFRTRDPREIRAKDAKMLDSRGRCSLVFVGVRGTRDRRRTAAARGRSWHTRLKPVALGDPGRRNADAWGSHVVVGNEGASVQPVPDRARTAVAP